MDNATGIQVRELPYVSWKNTLAHYETMKGPSWKKVLYDEEKYAKKFTTHASVTQRLSYNVALYKYAKHMMYSMPFLGGHGAVEIYYSNAFFLSWKFAKEESSVYDGRDIVCSPEGHVWTTYEKGQGDESFILAYYPKNEKSPKWKKYNVGPEIGYKDGKCFYTTVENRLWSNKLYMCDAKTGKNEVLLYEEKNPEINLYVYRTTDETTVLMKDNSQDRTYAAITTQGFLPQKDLYIIPSNWNVPKGSYGVDFVIPSHGLLITKHYGEKILWRCSSKKPPQKLLYIPSGSIIPDYWSVYEGANKFVIRVETPYQSAVYYTYESGILTKVNSPMLCGLQWKRHKVISDDGTVVHYIITQKVSKPKGLLVVGYGAYGSPTVTGNGYNRWISFLEEGWAIAYAFIRGGGDHDESWAKAGRVEGRVKTIQDYVSCIRDAQKQTGVKPKHTVIYGRSAGGFLMGATLNDYSDGSLMSAVYAEVPYVDVLRTTTNPYLPLTRMEYKEFGNPAHKLEDLISVASLSPVDGATILPPSPVFVLARTALHDSQVYTYEAIKWVHRLRKHSKQEAPKLVLVEKDQGHFTPADGAYYQYALDACLLLSWIQGELPNHA